MTSPTASAKHHVAAPDATSGRRDRDGFDVARRPLRLRRFGYAIETHHDEHDRRNDDRQHHARHRDPRIVQQEAEHTSHRDPDQTGAQFGVVGDARGR